MTDTEARSGTDIPLGSRVRVEFEGKYVRRSTITNRQIFDVGGKEAWAPTGATVTVLEPPEPPVRTILRSSRSYGSIYKRFSSGWYQLRDASVPVGPEQALTWREVYRRLGGPAGADIYCLVRDPVREDTPDIQREKLELPVHSGWGGGTLTAEATLSDPLLILRRSGHPSVVVDKDNALKLAAAILKAFGD